MCVLITFSVLFYIMTFYAIPVEEDMEYGLTGFLRRHGLSDSYNFAGMWNHIMHLYRDCNGRLIDKLPVPILVLCPKWFFALMNVGAIWLIVVAAYKIMGLALEGNAESRRFTSFMADYPWLASAFIILMSMFSPWDKLMMLVSYSVGYVWTAAVALWLVYYFINPRLIGGSTRGFCAFLVGSVVAGLLHELIPCVLCCAMLIPALCSPSRRLMFRRIAVIAALFVGYLILSHTPGHLHRVGYTDIHFDWMRVCPTRRGFMPASAVMPVVVYFLTGAVFIVWKMKKVSFAGFWQALKGCFVPNREASIIRDVNILFISGCVASIVILSLFDTGSRIMWYAILFSYMGGLLLLARWPGGIPRWFGVLLKSVLVAVAACGAAVWTLSCMLQRNISKAFVQGEKMIYETGADTIYLDLPVLMWSDSQYDNTYPWNLLVPFRNRHSSLNLNPLREPYDIVIVPEVFAGLEDEASYQDIIKMDSLPSGYAWINREEGILRYKDFYFYTNPQGIEFETPIEDVTRYLRYGGVLQTDAVFDNGLRRDVWFNVKVFTTPGSKTRAYWLEPALDSDVLLKHRIEKLDIIKITPSRLDKIDSGTYGRVQLFPNEPPEYQNKIIRP